MYAMNYYRAANPLNTKGFSAFFMEALVNLGIMLSSADSGKAYEPLLCGDEGRDDR